MLLGPGARLGPYEVVAAIGAGGMGEVYRARDSRLGREVAIKVLPELFASDPDRLARFDREAQLLASLNHPNIATIHGLEESGGVRALVMELVEGSTLADRIAEGSIPLEEALPIARQIAEALEAAHERGVIHRDLKPANIKLTRNGQVKVLDFGLAKMLEREPTASGMSMSPTLSVQATYAGVILGTAAYMSPEQARGKPADRRADIWAFGCVLFEMLTGKKAFDAGETVSDAIAAILKNEPDWTALPADTPANIRTLLRRCLQKEPQKRLPHIDIARIEIDEPPSLAPVTTAPPVPRQPRRFSWPLAVVTIVAMSLIYSALPWLQDDEPPTGAPEMRTQIVTPALSDGLSFAISPDGRRLVYAALTDGVLRLWLRTLNSESATALPGTEGAQYPFWSPDSRSIGFFAGTRLYRLDIDSNAPQVIAPVGTAAGRGGTWNREGVILFGSNAGSPIYRVSASGGPVTSATKLAGQLSHRYPQFLQDGRQFTFFAQGTSDTQGIYLGSLDSTTTRRLVANDTSGIYTPSGWLFWVRGGALVAQRDDPRQQRLVGDAVTVASQVSADGGVGTGAFSISTTGLITYRSGGLTRRQLTWFDRTGKQLGTLGTSGDGSLSAPRLSPDGRRAAVFETVQGNTDVWLIDSSRTTRFSFDPTLDRYPMWSRDGSKVVFDSNRKGTRDLFVKLANGGTAEELVLSSALDKSAIDWSPDGRFILFRTVDPVDARDLWVLPMDSRKPWAFLKTNYDETQAFFSPDGRWVVYQSNESGRVEIYLRRFIEPSNTGTSAGSGQWQVSTNGGIEPKWRKDGQELYYIAPGGEMMSVAVKLNDRDGEIGTPVKLFDTHIVGGGTDVAQGSQWDLSADGRFLINSAVDEISTPITILQNWKPLSN